MGMKIRMLQICNLWRLFPAYLCIVTANKKLKDLIFDEMEYWLYLLSRDIEGKFNGFSYLVLELKEYRNLVEYRLRKGGVLRRLLFRWFFPGISSLQICARNIGPRLFIQHGFSTIINAESIGCNCWINQQVTIGWNIDENPPVIGNGVRVAPGAKVLGSITINDNVIIGANAVVTKDVEENAVVGGVPAKFIRENINNRLYSKMKEERKEVL